MGFIHSCHAPVIEREAMDERGEKKKRVTTVVERVADGRSDMAAPIRAWIRSTPDIGLN